MESSNFPSILSAISLNILQKIGFQKSLVFSPISLSLSLVNNSLESSEPISSDITKNAPDFDLIDFKEKLESLVALLEGENLSSTIWRYPFSVEKQKSFFDFENNSKDLKFLSMDFDENLRISCEQEENKWAENGDFKVLYIPMADDDLSFVIFLPKSDSQKVLKNLDAEKFQNLIRELSPGFIDFEIPMFSIFSIFENSEISKPQKSSFQVSSQCTDDIGKCRIIPKKSIGMIKAPNDTIPFEFQANRSFLFCMIYESIPVIMGIFNGDQD